MTDIELYIQSGDMYNAWVETHPEQAHKAYKDQRINTLKSVKRLHIRYTNLTANPKDDEFYRYKVECAKYDYDKALLAASELIESISDTSVRKIFKMRYIDGMPLYDIAEAMHYSYNHTRKLHQRAIQAL